IARRDVSDQEPDDDDDHQQLQQREAKRARASGRIRRMNHRSHIAHRRCSLLYLINVTSQARPRGLRAADWNGAFTYENSRVTAHRATLRCPARAVSALIAAL